MYMLYLKTFQDALSYMNEKTGGNYNHKSFGIRIPFYLDKKTLKENKWLYAIFFVIKSFESLLDSIKFKLGIQ